MAKVNAGNGSEAVVAMKLRREPKMGKTKRFTVERDRRQVKRDLRSGRDD